MKSLSEDNQADIIEAINSPSRYMDDLLNIDHPYFEIYLPELQLKIMLQIPKPTFCIYIYLFQMALFQQK